MPPQSRNCTGNRVLHSGYNGLVPETKPFRLTESVKAAG